jgi:hypothetical protein
MTLHHPRLSFSLDPLMAEAKRRARQRRVLVALVVAAVVAAGAVLGFELRGLGSVTPVPANLTILAVGQNGGRALFHLRCDPASGNVAAPAKACAAIAAQPSIVTQPKPFYDMGPNTWYFTITGRLNGKPVHFRGESSWTPQMELINKLGLAGPHGEPLRPEPLRHGSVGLNQTRTFAAGVLRPGDFVSCRVGHSYAGPALSIAVPIRQGGGGYRGTQPGVLGIRMTADGAVIASCLARNQLPLSKRGRTRLPHGWPP